MGQERESTRKFKRKPAPRKLRRDAGSTRPSTRDKDVGVELRKLSPTAK